MSAVSSWSLHRTLGSYVSGDAAGRPPGSLAEPGAGLALLDLPAELRRRGYDTLQICHFHLPSREQGYLTDLRAALDADEITLDAVLIDDGDLTHPTDADAHQAWIDGWLDVATALGAHRARVIAGKQQPSPERLHTSGRRLAALAADHPEIRVVTENWFDLTAGPTEVHTILDAADGRVGLLIDLGNWTGPDKYDNLAAVARRAETCHAKCHFTANGPRQDDFSSSLRVLRQAGYTGPLALVYDGDDPDEWACLEQEHAIAARIFA
ncbi:TIM barrel protein [Actinopolymorpha sp. B9G3]|uniref:sugar phosphate isomerase/epimerase family protein n=1 Tax=Actinopolymorpha sp. B9G3 TaxID=3158970 RepID=UPI0032D9233E